MSQITLRIPDRLSEGLKLAAKERNLSLNRYAAGVLAAAIDPDLGETEFDRLRGRLARAGLLEPDRGSGERPSRARVDSAREQTGQGTPLSDLVADGRR